MIADKIQQIVETRSNAGLFSGVVSIRRAGAPEFERAYGYAHRGWRVPNSLDTRFRVASIGKMFTAVAVLQLIESGRLALDNGVAGLLGLDDTAIPTTATIEHMLTMTSGMADWFDEDKDPAVVWEALSSRVPMYRVRAASDYLQFFANKPPLAGVGARYNYNNAGYILLGMIVAQASGVPYFDYIRQDVFAPAGMPHSDFVALDALGKAVAEGYVPVAGRGGAVEWKKNIYSATPEAAGDGGAICTAADLAHFSLALRQERLLSPRMTQAMLSPKVLQGDQLVRGYRLMYGYGNNFLLDEGGAVVRWGHTGEEEGASCRLYHYPQLDTDVIILGNQSGCAGELGWEIHAALLGTG
jgi:CubicO group peptidase (beta-lactamase class C family)